MQEDIPHLVAVSGNASEEKELYQKNFPPLGSRSKLSQKMRSAKQHNVLEIQEKSRQIQDKAKTA